MRDRVAVAVAGLAGLVAVAAAGGTLAAVQGSSAKTSPAPHTNGGAPHATRGVARFTVTLEPFSVDVTYPEDITDFTPLRVTLAVTNTGAAAGWPTCTVSTVGTGARPATGSYWPRTKVRARATVHPTVRLRVENDGAPAITEKDVTASCAAAKGPGPPPSTKPHAIVPAVAPASLPASQVGSLQMFTAREGVAVGGIQQPHDLAGPVYLLATSDGGATWSVTGTLPVRLTSYELTFPDLAFENPSTGYLEVSDPASHHDIVLFTSDGGRRWETVTVTGAPTSISLDTGSLWVVSSLCPAPTRPPATCPSRLLTYGVGALAPASSQPIPVEPRAVFSGATLLGRLGPTAGVLGVGGSTPGPRALLVTTDAGQSWRQVDNACLTLSAPLTLTPSGFVVLGPDQWLLLCDQPAGMENDNVRLFRTGNGGVSWQLVAEHSVTPSLPDVGNIGAGSLSVSGNGRTLWMIGVNGPSWRQDGGVDFSAASGVTTGGVFSASASAGTSDGWLAVPFKGLYFTTNGTTWHLLH